MDEKRMKMIIEDRISNLPSLLIEFILTLMPLKDAVRTSILSSTWRYMWASCPKLLITKEFYEDNFKKEPLSQYTSAFVNVVKSIISCHVGRLHMLNLYIPNLPKDLIGFDIEWHVDRWVNMVLCNEMTDNTMMRNLCIENARDNTYMLSICFLYCVQLKALELSNIGIVLQPGFGGFCNLRRIRLSKISFSGNEFETLFTSARVLRDLILSNCDGRIHLKGDAPRLRNLNIHSWSKLSVLGIFGSTPRLKNVSLIGRTTTLAITMSGKAANLTNLLCSMPKVRSLELVGGTLRVLAAGGVPDPLPILLMRLRKLKLWWSPFMDLNQLQYVLFLLRCSPNLRIFFIQFGKINRMMVSEEEIVEYLERQKSLEPLCELQVVVLSNLMGSRDEVVFIKLLLAKTPLLRKMIIKTTDVAVSTEILGFPRASTKVELIFPKLNQS